MVPRDNKQTANKWVIAGVAVAIAVVTFLLSGGGSRAQVRTQCGERGAELATALHDLEGQVAKLQQPMNSAQARELADTLGKLAGKIKPPSDDSDPLHLLALVGDLENLARHVRASTSDHEDAYGASERVKADGEAIMQDLTEVTNRCR
jgi:hypothetical protein